MSSSRLTSRRDAVQLPSGTKLEYTLITNSGGASEDASQTTKLAICLHPWSWLGGRMNDPVLQLVTHPLLERGYEVLRYNSRGVGTSTGWPSFTGIREAEDLKELVLWVRSSRPNLSSLVIVGYSHGSLIASLHPVLPDVPTAHILLSYPLGPRQWLTAFHGAHYAASLDALVRDPHANVLVLYSDADNFTSAASYDAWAASLQDSSEEGRAPAAAAPPNAGEGEGARGSSEEAAPRGERRDKLRVVKLSGASHFWAEDGAADRLVDTVAEWLP